MDITKLTDSDLSYMEGFVAKCAELGIDPEQALKEACGKCGCGKSKPKAGKKPFGGKAAPLFGKKAQDVLGQPDAAQEPQKKTVLGGVGKGALAGAGIGAALGGAGMGMAGAAAAGKMPGDARQKLVTMLKLIAGGAVAGGASGALTGGMMGGVMRAVQ